MRDSKGFRLFIVISIAITLLIGGYSFTRVEETIHHQQVELAQERLNSCKFKLYDLAIGTSGRPVFRVAAGAHTTREAQIVTGALDVVNTIPSAQECVPVIRDAIQKEHRLTPKIERELVNLATTGTTTNEVPPLNGL